MIKDLTPWNYYEVVILAVMLYREARGETQECRFAVAHTVLNRVQNPGWRGNDIVSVVSKRFQYSSMTDPHDPQLTTWPKTSDHVFEECLNDALMVVQGIANSPLKGIDSYYDDSLQGEARPAWARNNPEKFVGKIGRLNFYNLDGDADAGAVNV